MKLTILSFILSTVLCGINIYQHELEVAIPWGLLALSELGDIFDQMTED